MGVEQAAVLGNSLGGRIGLELALRSPSRVSSLTLLDPSVPGFRWRYVMGFTKIFPSGFGAVPFPLRARMVEVMIKRLFADPGRLSNDAFAASFRLTLLGTLEALIRDAATAPRATAGSVAPAASIADELAKLAHSISKACSTTRSSNQQKRSCCREVAARS